MDIREFFNFGSDTEKDNDLLSIPSDTSGDPILIGDFYQSLNYNKIPLDHKSVIKSPNTEKSCDCNNSNVQTNSECNYIIPHSPNKPSFNLHLLDEKDNFQYDSKNLQIIDGVPTVFRLRDDIKEFYDD